MDVKPKILFEDNELFVISKPAGWITNEASTTKNQPVLQQWLSNTYSYETTTDKEYRDGIVHRLDKETSGLLLVAKTKKSFRNLQLQFKERRVVKGYKALVHGIPIEKSGEIDVPVGRLPWRRDRFGVLPGGRPALTKYTVLETYKTKKEKFALVSLVPKTGRTHQIRIHMKHLGHPLVSDSFYAGRKTSRNDRKWCPRLFLHAFAISFLHPVSNETVSFEDELPSDLISSLERLERLSIHSGNNLREH